MSVLSGLFGAGVSVRNALYDRGLLKEESLKGPVISIGNLCVGGTGKTPFTQLLGEMLAKREIAFDVLSRGYGRTSREIKLVDSQGAPRAFGDEPLLLAQHFVARGLQVPIIVGPDRYQAGQFAEKIFGPRIHLLDDGFQHRRLARTFDIVLLAPDDADQVLLPVGRLREPLTALRRADAVVVSDAVKISDFPVLPSRVWHVQRDIVIPVEVSPAAKVLAFCGIARPHRYFEDLRRRGVYPVAQLAFRDHHRYTQNDVDKIRREIVDHDVELCLTTIKDMMNLGEFAKQLGTVYPVQLTMSLADADAKLDEMLAVIAERRGARA